jgi:hypothetical protein
MGPDARETAIYALVEDSDAIPDTIQVVREKRQGDEVVVAATFRRSSGRLVRGFVGIFTRDDFGWHAGGGWSSGPRHVPAEAIWASSGGWGSTGHTHHPDVAEEAPPTEEPARGVSGGWVNDPSAASIRVTDPNGRIEEDTIESAVAILIWEGDFDVWHATAELLDEHGRVIRTGPMRPRG